MGEAALEIEIDEDVFLPCYRHLVHSTHDINFLWGGRDSGKSHFIAQKLILDCLQSDYFRCILIKKTGISIKDAQFQAIKDIIYEWEIDHLFRFKEHPLEIHCINGNKFISRGCDEPERLKSIANPSHVWIEEGNQLTQDDYIILSTTLRTNRGRVQQWFSFNPEPEENYLDFWLFKDFFENIPHDIYNNFEHKRELTLPDGTKVETTYSSTHTTYAQNRYCKAERIALLEQLQHINPYYYTVFTKGRWGSKSKDALFAFAFNRETHCGIREVDRNQIVYLSFDFNRNPITCGVIQHINNEIRVLEGIKLETSDIYKLCERIRLLYPGFMFLVGGDASGQNGNAMVRDNLNYYKIIQKELNLLPTQFKVPSVNPRIEENQLLVNALLYKYKVVIHPQKAYTLVYDMENVRMRADGSMVKGDREDPTQQADSLDWFRYWCNTYAKNFVQIV
jgi:phage terminase large subunit